jgi:hypothetical protein
MKTRLAASAAVLLALGACSDRDDDVVQPSGQPVTESAAEAAQTEAAVAFGMTRRQLEDADLISTDGADLGDVETLILDAAGAPVQVVIDLEGVDDKDVVLALSDVRAAPATANGRVEDLTVDMTAAQLAALPAWTPPAR